MSEVVHRVISGDDVCDNPQQQPRPSEEQQVMNSEDTHTTINAENTSSNPPAMIVEPDTEEFHNAPVDLISPHNRQNSETFTTSSSLSDASQDAADPKAQMTHQVDVYMEDIMGQEAPTPLAGVSSSLVLNQHPPAHYQQHLSTKSPPQRLQRMDSSDGSDSGSARDRATTTSQNSSRDWGWFEDVHQSGQLTPTGSLTKGHRAGGSSQKKPKNKPIVPRMVIGMDPKDETAAAAMAVTAPTYVLEESLSSQRLWKDTAGNRPPQPVEERAFFEQMWAQNFAQSQVNYDMPTEVLTATSPISLSPFADGGVMEMSAEVAAGDGGNFQQYNMNMNTPANTHNMMMMPSGVGKAQEGKTGDSENSSGSAGLKEAPRAPPPTILPPTQHQHIVNKTAKTASGDDLTVMVRGDNVFGTTVSKSFACTDEKGSGLTVIDTVNISIASYRVVDSHKKGKYAQFLVIYREGSIRDTIGVWKRYSDFDDLARKVTQAHEGCASVIANMSPLAITEEQDVEHLPNAITSWRLLKKRQRWYRCLDAGYLSLKVFLLERFLHDILFESSSPKLLREFVGTDEAMSRS